MSVMAQSDGQALS